MQVALDDGPGPPIKYQYPDLTKLHQVVSHLVRSSDVSSRCQSSNGAIEIRPNIYSEPNIPPESLIPLSPEAVECLFNRTSYIKKLIEDTNIGEEGIKLLQYCSWENPHFSRALLTELLWHCGFAYWHDMRHHTDLLLHILLMEDSWQHHRIHNAISGVSEDREGLLETIHRNKSNYQKRAYQCIKCLVNLFSRSRVAMNILRTNQLLTRQWSAAVEWLQDELERQRSVRQYNYNQWSPPAQSNENTNGFTLERSQSAKSILQMAFNLCPEDVSNFFVSFLTMFNNLLCFYFVKEPEEPNDPIEAENIEVLTKDGIDDLREMLAGTSIESSESEIVPENSTVEASVKQNLINSPSTNFPENNLSNLPSTELEQLKTHQQVKHLY